MDVARRGRAADRGSATACGDRPGGRRRAERSLRSSRCGASPPSRRPPRPRPLDAKQRRRRGDRSGRGRRSVAGRRAAAGPGRPAAERRHPQRRRREPAPRDDGPGEGPGRARLHQDARRAGRGPRPGGRAETAAGGGLRPPAGAGRGRCCGSAGRWPRRLDLRLLLDGKELEQRTAKLMARRHDRGGVPGEPATRPGCSATRSRPTPLPGEVSAANNTASLLLRVVDQPVRVLLLEGKPYWDTKFLIRSSGRGRIGRADRRGAACPGPAPGSGRSRGAAPARQGREARRPPPTSGPSRRTPARLLADAGRAGLLPDRDPRPQRGDLPQRRGRCRGCASGSTRKTARWSASAARRRRRSTSGWTS